MNRKRIAAIAFTYTGAVIGAGFSSGQEIWRFFASHGFYGLYGIILSILFFIILASFLFRLGKKLGVNSYHQLFYDHIPVTLSFFFDLTYSFFLFGSVAVMLAGIGTIFQELFSIEYLTGLLVALVFILAVLYLKIEGIFTVNTFMIPILTIITIGTVIIYLPEFNINFFRNIMYPGIQKNWLLDSILYSSYNLTISVAVMTGVLYKEDERDIFKGGIWGGLLLVILNTIIFIGLLGAFHSKPAEEIPMLFLAKKGGRGWYLAYVLALFIAMISTAITNFFAFNQRITSLFKIDYVRGLLITSILIIPLACSGFSTLVGKLYPVYGYLGLVIITYYIYLWIKEIW